MIEVHDSGSIDNSSGHPVLNGQDLCDCYLKAPPCVGPKVAVKMDLGYELRRILSLYQEQEGTTMSGAIRDAMTELVHICDENNLDADDRFDAAIEVAIQERTDKEETATALCKHGRNLGYGCCDWYEAPK